MPLMRRARFCACGEIVPIAGGVVMRNSLAAAVVAAIGISLSPVIVNHGVAHAADIAVLSANVFTGVLDELADKFQQTSGHKVTIIYGTAGVIGSRVQAGAPGDATILPRPILDELLRQGTIAPGSIVDLARSAVGVAVRAGAPKPDIRSVDALKRALLTAKSISYPDPT